MATGQPSRRNALRQPRYKANDEGCECASSDEDNAVSEALGTPVRTLCRLRLTAQHFRISIHIVIIMRIEPGAVERSEQSSECRTSGALPLTIGRSALWDISIIPRSALFIHHRSPPSGYDLDHSLTRFGEVTSFSPMLLLQCGPFIRGDGRSGHSGRSGAALGSAPELHTDTSGKHHTQGDKPPAMGIDLALLGLGGRYKDPGSFLVFYLLRHSVGIIDHQFG